MVRSEIFGIDPILIFLVMMLGLIILAMLVLQNKDPLLVIAGGLFLVISTFLIGNWFEYDIYSFSHNFTLSILHLTVSQNQLWLVLYLFLNEQLKAMNSPFGLINIVTYGVALIIMLLTVIKGYGALRGGWKALHKDQFKDK